jgi:GntR family transcriptional regulator
MTVLSEHPRTPLYQRCQSDLRTRIERGEFAVEQPLPSEDELCRAYGVSRITVRRAVSELIRVGLLSRRQGSGTFVTRPPTYAKSLSLIGSLESVMSLADGVTHKLLRRAAASVPADILKTFKLAPAAAERMDVLYSRGVPFAHASIFVAPRIFAALDHAALARSETSIFHLIEDKNGKPVAHVDQTIAAVAAPAGIALALRLRKGYPVMRALRAYFSRDGQVVHSAVIHYHPERFNIGVRFIP